MVLFGMNAAARCTGLARGHLLLQGIPPLLFPLVPHLKDSRLAWLRRGGTGRCGGRMRGKVVVKIIQQKGVTGWGKFENLARQPFRLREPHRGGFAGEDCRLREGCCECDHYVDEGDDRVGGGPAGR